MSDLIGRLIPGLDPVAGTVALPLWAAGAVAALFAVLCILAFGRAGREGTIGGLARLVLVFIGATLAWVGLEATSHQSRNAERLALDARLSELAARTAMPGSALGCLDGIAGDVVEAHCEKALFATPQAMAAAASYVATQLALLADAADFVSRGNPGYEPSLAQLRRALEADRYGLVAHVLARQGCTADQCSAFESLTDTTRISANLASRTYNSYVQRHATVWPAIAPSPVANLPAAPPAFAASPALPAATSAYVAPRVPGPNVFFPSSNSIPPVSIMTSEPSSPESETTGAATGTPAAKRAPAPPRRPAQSAPSAPQSSAPPIDLNAAARAGTPPTATQ